MEKCLLPVLLLWAIIYTTCAEETDNGYVFTSPRTWNGDANNDLQLRFYGKHDAGTLKVQVYYTDSYQGNESLATEKEYPVEADVQDSFFQLYLPSFDNYVYNGKVVIEGAFGDYSFSGNDTIYFGTAKEKIGIIQTDKPIYKEGQTVKFRVVFMDKKLKPVAGTAANIWVEDPKGTRLFQWKNVQVGRGIKQLEFPLADEPVEGEWKISLTVGDNDYYTTFEVKEYVLPKYEIDITIPPFVLANAEEIPITVCAKYTYGQPVKGLLALNVSLEKYVWSNEKVPEVEYNGEFDGCYDYKINVSLVEPGDYYRYRRIQIVARVTEQGTGVERNETKFIQRQYSPLNLNFNQEQKQYFKPGLPYNGELKVRNPDDTPASGESIEICATISRERELSHWWATKKVKFCRNYTSNDDGIIKYTIPPQNADSTKINLDAKATCYAKNPNTSGRENSLTQPQTSTSLTPWYSPSGNFIQLQPEQDVLKCDTEKNLKLLFTSKTDSDFTFFYQVLRQGVAIASGKVDTSFSVKDDVSHKYQDDEKLVNERETQILPPVSEEDLKSSTDEECPSAREARYIPPIGEVDLSVSVDPSLSPSFYVLVYYLRDDREVIADSQKFTVEKCFKNKVALEFGDEVAQPGTKTTVTLRASPNSLCGVKIVDKSISLLNSNDQLTTEKVFNFIESMDIGRYYGVNRCNEKTPQPGLYSKASDLIVRPKPWSASSYEDSLAAFENCGLLVISDLTLFTRPCKSNRGGDNVYYDYSSDIAPQSAGHAVALASTARRPAAPEASNKMGAAAATKSAVDVRNYFPETWLFQMQMTGPEGELVTKERLPHTITEWIGSAVCMSSEDGLGISNSTSIKGFQAFFLSFTLPYSVIRGETFTVSVSLFNYVDDALPIRVSLDESDAFTVVGDAIDGDVCLQPGGGETLQLKVKAETLGTVNMTVRAETKKGACGDQPVSDSVAKDAVTNSFIVEPEGFPTESVESTLACPKDEENGSYEQKLILSVPDDVVPDSARSYLDVTGNVLGPSLDNLENLVQVPTGCGEQNMVKFVPNLVVLDFFTETGKLTDKIKNRAIKNLNTGAQQEMNYRHDDGSFSAFGYRDKEGSMFLTAFVLRFFSEAQRYITIDNSTLQSMQNFIISKQQPDGCFPDVGRIFDTGFQGGIEKEKAQGVITAYVLTSLLISGYDNETVINPALSCLAKDDSILSPYATFLYAYAEAYAGKMESAKTRIAGAREIANKTGGVEYYNNENDSQSKDIETAAYALLAILKTGGTGSDVLPIVRYLTQKMNPRGGFISTQDTCVGLQALGEFAKITYSDETDITVVCSGSLDKEIRVIEDDKMIVKRNKISDVPSEVNIKAEGSGCVLIQNVLRYNTKSPPEKKMFNLDVTGKCSDDRCKKGVIKVSISYIPDGKQAGMTVLEIKMLSGIVPVKESLDEILSDKKIGIMRSDIEDNAVVLYFNEMSNSATVFSFEVEEAIEVENPQPGTAKVYEYYAKENSASTSYTIEKCEGSSCS